MLVAKIRPRNQTPTSSTAGTKLRPAVSHLNWLSDHLERKKDQGADVRYMEALEKELAGLVKKLKSNQVESAL